MNKSTTTQAGSDEQLLARVRMGDTDAFGELWRRHSRSGATVARGFTSIDPDDLVSEAFASIYQCTVAGGGPTGAFRPYLYTTIRNLACTWGRARKEVAVDEIAETADPSSLDDPAIAQLDSSLTAQAFRALPERWQTVLWYTEVEGMDPHEVAPLIGLSPNGVSALAYRAREGLRSSWLQAHVTDATAAGSCRWTIERLGDRTRRGLSRRERTRVDEHLGVCGRCSSIAEEVDEVGSRIAAIMAPLLIGGGIGGGVLAGQLAQPGAAMASELVMGTAAELTAAAAPAAVAPAVVALSASGSAGLVSATSGTTLAGLLVAVAVAGSAFVGVMPASFGAAATSAASSAVSSAASSAPERPTAEQVAAPIELRDPSDGPDVSPTEAASPGAQEIGPGAVRDLAFELPPIGTPSDVLGGATGAVGGIGNGVGGTVDAAAGTVGGVVDGLSGVTEQVTAPLQNVIPALPLQPGPPPPHTAPPGPVTSDLRLDLSGTGMPGATVSAQAAGVVYGTAVVSRSGTWAVRTSVLPAGLGALQLSQRLTVLGIAVPVDIPLAVLSDTLGIHIDLL